jgi:hypothetical protein
VRPHLRKKLEPFQIIMDTVKTLNNEDTFVLHVTFKPTPLLGVMKTKGYVSRTEQLDKDHWVVTFVHKSRKDAFPEEEPTRPGNQAAHSKDAGPQVYELDNRGLEPPQPMIRTLNKLEASRPGDKVIIHNDRIPVFLLEELNSLGYPYSVDDQPDGSARVTISKV